MKVWAGWLGLAMALSVSLAGCSSNNSTAVTLSISPTTTTVLLGTSVQFVPAEAGSENGIQWSVDGINNGNATVGTIDSTGLYTAPETLPVPPSSEVVPVLFAEPNAGIAGSGSTGSIIELQGGYDFTNFAVGNTITIIGNSVANWNASFVIVASGPLNNGNFGVQIATPAGPPIVGTGGTATVTPGVTIGAQVEETSVVATATVTLDSGIRVSLSQTSYTIGTNEQYLFSTSNAFGPTVTVTGTSNQAVVWSVTSGTGTIDPNSGLYTAPSTPETDTVTATSVVDPTQFASATVSVVTAVDPTVSSISPPNGALGAAFQEVFITGSNFISTTNVFVNGTLLPSGALFETTSTTLFVIVPDSVLSANFPVSGNTVPLTFTVGRQNGAQQSCSPLPCQLVLSPVRPALVASKPDSVQASAPGAAITLDGGYFGTTNATLGFQGNPMVSVQLAGQPASFIYNSDRELLVTATPGSLSTPGLYPITVTGTASGSANGSMATANLAVEPTSTPSQIASPTVGTTPSSVAINTATGVAVVANQGSNDITLVSLPDGPLAAGAIITQSLCTGALGSGSASSPGCVTSAPISVAVDNIRNLALVANSAVTNPTLAVVNLGVSPPQVTALLTFPSADSAGNPFNLIPRAVGINPVTGRALVDFTSSASTGSNAGAILDMNQIGNISGTITLPAAGATPVLINVANISNGLNTHIAVSPRLNWALATPGGVGALSIVDLGRQTTNQIGGISCAAGSSPPTVTVVTSTVNSVQVGQPVLISGVTPGSFNGIFSVASASNTSFTYYALAPCPSGAPSGSGGLVSYANPVASIGVDLNVRSISINDETAKALLVDPTSSEPAFIFDILDQSSLPVNNLPSSTNNIAGAINPLTNGGLVLNKGGQAFEIDPTVPTVICSSQPCPSPTPATFSTGTTPVDVAIDPITNTAVIANQGGTVSLYSLGALTSNPQIIQTSVALPAAGSPTSSQVTLNSSLGAAATASDQTVTLIGHFDGSSVPQLDGVPAPFTSHTVSANGRVMTATLSGATLAANGPRRYAVQAADSATTASNAARLPVIQAVSLVTGDCSAPAPQGVAINSGVTSLGLIFSAAIVTEPGCNDVSMVSLSDSSGFTHGTGFGGTPELAVQSDPQGVDVYSPTGLAVVANAGSNSVSIVDMVNDDVPTTFTTDPVPDGVAVDLGTGNALVTANGASVVDTFPVSTSSQTPSTIGVQQGPSGVAVDPLRGVAAVANSSNLSNDVSILDLSSSSTTTTTTAGSIVFPQGVAFDPITDTFMVTSGSNNQVVLLNPVTAQAAFVRVGIDPSSIAYNPLSSTLVTANNLSGTVTMVDFLDHTVRAVFSLNSSSQFAVAIQPQTNLAVVADAVDNQLLLVPLPN